MRDDLKKVFDADKGDKIIDIQTIIKDHAYRDAQRTFKGVDQVKRDEVLEALSDKFDKYTDEYTKTPITNQEAFDKWHEEACNWFVKEFKKAVSSNVTIGQAQKIINMTFKNMYRYGNYDISMFKYCHMALDSYTLDWYKRVVRNSQKKEDRLNGDFPSWSKLSDYGPRGNGKYSYIEIQRHIADYLNSTKNFLYRDNEDAMTPFVAEFYIWPEEQLRSARSVLIKYKSEIKNLRFDHDAQEEYKVIKEICNSIPQET